MSSRLGIAGIVLLAAFGLAACGGGGSSGTADTDPPPPTTEELQAAEIEALQAEINALRAQLGLGPADSLSDSIAELQEQAADLQQRIENDKEAARMAMAATAAKLYKGIYAPAADANGTEVGDVHAAYNADDTAIVVTMGDGTAANATTLSADKKTMVPDNHGWKGKRYTRTKPASDGTYEAVVYSNVGSPTPGDKFGQIGVGTPAPGYEYGLNAAGQTAVNTSTTAAYVNLIGSSSFDHSAGVKRFPRPSPNQNVETVVTVSGTFHGVPGTYSCTPGTAVCAVNVSGMGFQLGTVPSATDAQFTDGGGTWMFKPANTEARVMDAPDTAYASYGWWLHKTENDLTYTASAFQDEKGSVPAASGLDALNGTAKYVGGAAGKYALTSKTGGTNDAGHFTARATLEADFTNNTEATAISGTIDMFMGADGMPRDWEVKLNASDIGDDGGIGNAGDGTDPVMTVWTIDGTAGVDGGSWTGSLQNNGADGVPKVATGTFYSTYGGAGEGEGRMVGGFGANRQ